MQIERLLYINENFFIENGLENHEISFYFLMKSIDRKSVNKESNSCGYHEYLRWIPIKDLANYKAFPSFLKTNYKAFQVPLNLLLQMKDKSL